MGLFDMLGGNSAPLFGGEFYAGKLDTKPELDYLKQRALLNEKLGEHGSMPEVKEPELKGYLPASVAPISRRRKGAEDSIKSLINYYGDPNIARNDPRFQKALSDLSVSSDEYSNLQTEKENYEKFKERTNQNLNNVDLNLYKQTMNMPAGSVINTDNGPMVKKSDDPIIRTIDQALIEKKSSQSYNDPFALNLDQEVGGMKDVEDHATKAFSDRGINETDIKSFNNGTLGKTGTEGKKYDLLRAVQTGGKDNADELNNALNLYFQTMPTKAKAALESDFILKTGKNPYKEGANNFIAYAKDIAFSEWGKRVEGSVKHLEFLTPLGEATDKSKAAGSGSIDRDYFASVARVDPLIREDVGTKTNDIDPSTGRASYKIPFITKNPKTGQYTTTQIDGIAASGYEPALRKLFTVTDNDGKEVFAKDLNLTPSLDPSKAYVMGHPVDLSRFDVKIHSDNGVPSVNYKRLVYLPAPNSNNKDVHGDPFPLTTDEAKDAYVKDPKNKKTDTELMPYIEMWVDMSKHDVKQMNVFQSDVNTTHSGNPDEVPVNKVTPSEKALTTIANPSRVSSTKVYNEVPAESWHQWTATGTTPGTLRTVGFGGEKGQITDDFSWQDIPVLNIIALGTDDRRVRVLVPITKSSVLYDRFSVEKKYAGQTDNEQQQSPVQNFIEH